MAIRKDLRSKRQPAWTLDYVDENSKRCRKRIYCSKSVAETQLGLILSEIEKRKRGLSTGERYMPLKDLIMKYLMVSETDGKSPLTVTRIKNATDALQRIIGAKILITDITEVTLENYKQIRLTEVTPRGTKLTLAGLIAELKHQKAMFNWAVRMRYLVRSPFVGVLIPKIMEKPVRFLSPSEIKSLYYVINEANDIDARDLVTFYLQTGARRSEILPPKFTWNNVNLTRKLIVITGKRNKRRTLPLNNLLEEILKRRKSFSHPFTFSGYQVSGRIKKYYKLAHIENANVHTLRKTCGSLLIQKGVDIYRVSKWLGHSTVAVTERHYVDLLNSEYEDIALLLGQTSVEFEIEKSGAILVPKYRPNQTNGDQKANKE
ncbi:site-specific integrase [Candidatus Marinimicrobia bacterium MT.SAG.2]|nr:site-specific integrase [Candidatus Marinimicrobia bacterium MT.SAG.2]